MQISDFTSKQYFVSWSPTLPDVLSVQHVLLSAISPLQLPSQILSMPSRYHAIPSLVLLCSVFPYHSISPCPLEIFRHFYFLDLVGSIFFRFYIEGFLLNQGCLKSPERTKKIEQPLQTNVQTSHQLPAARLHTHRCYFWFSNIH